LGDGTEEEKPKRASIPRGVDAATLGLDRALELLSLPREVGLHPESGKPIVAGLGRYGPFVLHDGMYANLESVEDLFTVGLNRAVALIAEKAAGGGKSRFQRAKPTVLKELGEHPDGGPIQVLSGRYGPYVKHASINATIPNGKDPAAITLEEAIELIAARAAKAANKPAKKAAKKTAHKTPAKTAAKSTAKTPRKTAAKSAKPASKSAKGRSAKAKTEAVEV
ncbi:MAG: topoisomerase C-terminal repeat-containing protein, partial [Hyphomicrobium sp.]